MEKLQVAGQKQVIKKKPKAGCVRYAECKKNHAVKDGGSVVDGCEEFIASNENGGSALTCSCCGCHRNYHRRVEETDQESFGVGEQKKRKSRELTSKVWDDFTRTIDKYENIRAICKHCKGQFDGSSHLGTRHLDNHLKSIKCRATRNGGDGIEDISTKIRDLATLTHVVMKEKPPVIDLIKQMFNEDGEFTEDWYPSVLNSRKDEILQVYQEEKEKEDKLISNLSCRFSLHIYEFVADNVMLMVRYIDDNWKRQTEIISIIPSENFMQETKKLCLDLKIDRNISSIHYDVSLIDEDNEEIIESWFSQRGSLPFVRAGFDFFNFRVRVGFFKDGWEMDEIDGLRECVDYGYETTSNKLKLQSAVNKAKIMGKEVIFNDLPCSYDPLEYLKLAVGLKEAFSELEKIDSDFSSINLTNQEWDEATATLEHFKALEEFVESVCLDNCNCITMAVVDILKLFPFHSSEDCQVCKNASYKNLFDRVQVYLVLVILDPRFKMDTIEYWYKEIYDSDADGYLEKTLKDFRDVYNEYAKESSGEDYKMMDAMGRPCTSSTKSELELYLHHLKVPAVEGFDILDWWRGNAHSYPTLARMARDYLAIPFSIHSTLKSKIGGITCCSEIDDSIKFALVYLIGGLR